eukprot:g14212.t1
MIRPSDNLEPLVLILTGELECNFVPLVFLLHGLKIWHARCNISKPANRQTQTKFHAANKASSFHVIFLCRSLFLEVSFAFVRESSCSTTMTTSNIIL